MPRKVKQSEKTARLHILVPESTKSELEATAEKYNTDVSTIVRLILKSVLKQV